ncbi:SMC-Scp complex subunit ScpB [Clostridium chauvoei]|uniref:Segregation and condensation protein B n=2 Tax=Clostridium chauvoei TaxID=46867 RepID=A0A1U6JDJ6_9CLOT|nr:SMC-Scp complex subunit ScpB [Clostridium chauvoei]ATD55167.1 SMC-Scp complex subunit ScpB [Clostridium chauvoei]ATD57160.1 SMC-Scp complex subunit ScpB [Clostridium chauvoei]MBX7279507.1 segregation/condensation protein B [Clostridium chauvoei]MBX7281876.1 segregation/condensation protein B [Clostridium chauvoei]MBX7284535.1 segregation/condensation protein B [Clostridium chauvoei]
MNKIEINQFEFQGASKKNRIKSSIESLLFVSGEPLNLKTLSSNVEVAPKVLEKILDEMMDEYEEESRGIKLISINGEYQLVTKAQNSEFVQRLLKKNKRQSLSQASLESLAIIAYKQPITRVDIDEIRGVKSESAIQRLIEKELIKEVGRLEVPGRPILFGTTEEFLRQFGLKALNDLPSLDLYSEKEQDESLEILNNAMKEL